MIDQYLSGEKGTFNQYLMQAMIFADAENKEKLKKAFPQVFAVLESYYIGE